MMVYIVSLTPEDVQDQYAGGSPAPDPGRLKDMVAYAFKEAFKDAPVGKYTSQTVILNAPSSSLSHGLVGTFGRTFTDALKSLGGEITVDADVGIGLRDDHYHPGQQEKYIEVKVNDFIYVPKGPSSVASTLRKIASKLENSKNPDRSLVIADIKRVLNSLT